MKDITHYWDESDFEPATAEQMRDGLREAMVKFAHLLPPPEEDVCECFTCRSFRGWMKS